MICADDDFRRFRGKARRSKVLSILTGKNDDMITFEEVKSAVSTTGESYIGCKTVPVEQIVGSEDRVADFNRSFLPRREFLKHRWCSVDSAYYEGTILPPVKLLELGGLYFVRDGNHRVSIARAHRVGYIDAEIIRIDTKVKLHPKMTLAEIEMTSVADKDAA